MPGETVANYAYDAADRLIRYQSGANNPAHTYAYNGLGDRYRQTVGDVTTSYLLDLNTELTQVLGEFKPGDTTYYLLGLDVIGQQQNGTWGYFGYDGLGSVRQMTDAAGVVQYGVNFDPYGQIFEQFGPVAPNLGFTGEYTDPSGLLYLRARYANPSTATFLTRDPFEGVMDRVMSRNGYSYAEGNPINYADPSGEIFWVPAAALAVAAYAVMTVIMTLMFVQNAVEMEEMYQKQRQEQQECVQRWIDEAFQNYNSRHPSEFDEGEEAPLPMPEPNRQPNPDRTKDDEQKPYLIWRLTSTASNFKGFNWNPKSNDWDGLSGTKGGEGYWLNPAEWILTTMERPLKPTDVILGATRESLVAAGFSVDDTPDTEHNDPHHVSIGGTSPGIINRDGAASWPGSKSERKAIAERLKSLFTIVIWKSD